MQQKTVQQPIVTDAEIAKTERYNRSIQARGIGPGSRCGSPIPMVRGRLCIVTKLGVSIIC